jgi:hypothetical protein
MHTTTRRALGIGLLAVVAIICWLVDFVALFAISGSSAFGGGPMSPRQMHASQLVSFGGLSMGFALVIAVIAIGKRWLRSWWALGAVATAMLSVTALALAVSAPIAASGECLDWATDRDCGIWSQIQRDHVVAGLGAIALALSSIALTLWARRASRQAGPPLGAGR